MDGAHKDFDKTTAKFSSLQATVEQRIEELSEGAREVFELWSSFDKSVRGAYLLGLLITVA
jgi:replication-associated recombination protein RarA